MVHLQCLQCAQLQVPLHGEHFRHAIGNRCPSGKHHPTAAVGLLDVSDFEEHIQGPLRGGLRQTGNSGHLGNIEQVLKMMRLIDKQPINPEFLEG